METLIKCLFCMQIISQISFVSAFVFCCIRSGVCIIFSYASYLLRVHYS